MVTKSQDGTQAEGIALPVNVDKGLSTPLPDQLTQELRRLISDGTLRPGMLCLRAVGWPSISESLAAVWRQRMRSLPWRDSSSPPSVRPRGSIPTCPPPRRRWAPNTEFRTRRGGACATMSTCARGSAVTILCANRPFGGPGESLDVDPGPIDPLGQPRARWAIADYLRLTRGMAVDPDEIILTSGSRDGLRLLLSLGVPGSIAVENPGFPGLRQAMTDQQLVPLDLVGSSPARADVAAAVVTPNHQFPHGTPMPVDQRARLLDWAARGNVLIVEDDYDSEARFTRTVLPTLFDLATSSGSSAQVVHIGTFSALLTSAVSTGYVIARGPISEELMSLRAALGPAYSPILQMAIASYLGSGGLRRRISRGRRRLRAAEEVVSKSARSPGWSTRDAHSSSKRLRRRPQAC